MGIFLRGSIVMNEKIFIIFFPRPPEPIPFIFRSKEDYFKAREARHNLGYARDEWENCIIQKKEITEDEVSRWKLLYDEYNKLLETGMQERFKS
jgi:hypothetical protein